MTLHPLNSEKNQKIHYKLKWSNVNEQLADNLFSEDAFELRHGDEVVSLSDGKTILERVVGEKTPGQLGTEAITPMEHSGASMFWILNGVFFLISLLLFLWMRPSKTT